MSQKETKNTIIILYEEDFLEMKIRNKVKHILSAVLAASTLLSTMPTLTYAAQVNEYVDPADKWVTANGRTNELDKEVDKIVGTQKENPAAKGKTANKQAAQANSRRGKKS